MSREIAELGVVAAVAAAAGLAVAWAATRREPETSVSVIATSPRLDEDQQQVEYLFSQIEPWRFEATAPTIDIESRGELDAMNLNEDGAGLSIGIIQWSQGGGGMATFMEGLSRYAASAAYKHLGPLFPEVKTRVSMRDRDAREEPVGGVRLWEGVWVPRFRSLLQDPIMESLQYVLALSDDSPYFDAASDAAKMVGTTSMQDFAILFDMAVQNGPVVRRWASRAADLPTDARGRVRAMERMRVARFQRDSKPSSGDWRLVNGKWHRFVGRSVDLAQASINRNAKIRAALPDRLIPGGMTALV